jgi:hypothetical protein
MFTESAKQSLRLAHGKRTFGAWRTAEMQNRKDGQMLAVQPDLRAAPYRGSQANFSSEPV